MWLAVVSAVATYGVVEGRFEVEVSSAGDGVQAACRVESGCRVVVVDQEVGRGGRLDEPQARFVGVWRDGACGVDGG